MESRLLSRASAITGLPQLRPKLSSRDTVSVSFAWAKPIGAVGEGGNLIWGRQLRPSLLLESSRPVSKREILKPVLAAAEGGSNSAG